MFRSPHIAPLVIISIPDPELNSPILNLPEFKPDPELQEDKPGPSSSSPPPSQTSSPPLTPSSPYRHYVHEVNMFIILSFIILSVHRLQCPIYNVTFKSFVCSSMIYILMFIVLKNDYFHLWFLYYRKLYRNNEN